MRIQFKIVDVILQEECGDQEVLWGQTLEAVQQGVKLQPDQETLPKGWWGGVQIVSLREVDFNSKPAHLWYVPLMVCERIQRLCSHGVSGMLEEVVGQEHIKARGREWSVDSQCREFFRVNWRLCSSRSWGGQGLGLFWNGITGECLNAFKQEFLCRQTAVCAKVTKGTKEEESELSWWEEGTSLDKLL